MSPGLVSREGDVGGTVEIACTFLGEIFVGRLKNEKMRWQSKEEILCK